MRYLADTSLWVDHLRAGNDKLAARLDDDLILIHPFVIGELACGNIKNRANILRDLRRLPSVRVATDSEVHRLLELRRLYARGIGWIDAHLAASALLSECGLLTLDKSLATIAKEFGIPDR